MQIFAALDARMPLSDVARTAERLERLGFDGIHIPETIHDSFSVALLAAEHTSRITLRTAVSLAFVRSPTQIAYNAWTLATFSGGRFELGLGTQIRQNIEDRFGMPWTEPVPRMREYVEVVQHLFEPSSPAGPCATRGITTGSPGCSRTSTRGRLRSTRRRSSSVPSTRACASSRAPWPRRHHHSTNSDPPYLRDVVLPAATGGAAVAGRASPPRVMASATVATGADREAVEQARERQRRMLAFLYSTPSYRPTLERHGWPELFDQLQALTRSNAGIGSPRSSRTRCSTRCSSVVRTRRFRSSSWSGTEGSPTAS